MLLHKCARLLYKDGIELIYLLCYAKRCYQTTLESIFSNKMTMIGFFLTIIIVIMTVIIYNYFEVMK